MSVSGGILGLLVGYLIPFSVMQGPVPIQPHCTAGCKLFIAGRAGVICNQIQVSIGVLGGHPGICECYPSPTCKKVLPCDLDLEIGFSILPGLPGCVFNQKAGGGGEWETDTYQTTVAGCGAFGDARILGYSPTCDPTNITCLMTLKVYCNQCKGTCP